MRPLKRKPRQRVPVQRHAPRNPAFRKFCLQQGGTYERGECHIGNYSITHEFSVLNMLKDWKHDV